MALHKEGYSIVLGAVSGLPEIQGKTLEAAQKDAVVTYSRVEIGGGHYGFHYKVSKDGVQGQFYMGDC